MKSKEQIVKISAIAGILVTGGVFSGFAKETQKMAFFSGDAAVIDAEARKYVVTKLQRSPPGSVVDQDNDTAERVNSLEALPERAREASRMFLRAYEERNEELLNRLLHPALKGEDGRTDRKHPFSLFSREDVSASKLLVLWIGYSERRKEVYLDLMMYGYPDVGGVYLSRKSIAFSRQQNTGEYLVTTWQ